MSPAATWLVAAVGSVALNAAAVATLAALSRSEAAASERLRSTVRAVPPPPPPVDPPPPTPSTALAEPVASLPALELPALGVDSGGLAVPETDPSLLTISAAPVLPSFAAAQPGTQNGMDEAMRFEEAELYYQPPTERFYPRSALVQALEGRTRLKIRIDARGRVVSTAIVSSEPQGAFDAAAEAYVRQWRYRPARRGGRPQPTTRTVEVIWSLSE